MNINFSHNYPKLHDERDAKLLAVFISQTSCLSSSFIEYDTIYHENGIDEYYPLPEGKVLVLLFLGARGNLFTTVREYKESKAKYYQLNVGRWFQVKVKYAG